MYNSPISQWTGSVSRYFQRTSAFEKIYEIFNQGLLRLESRDVIIWMTQAAENHRQWSAQRPFRKIIDYVEIKYLSLLYLVQDRGCWGENKCTIGVT
jgi:hypothetical protein